MATSPHTQTFKDVNEEQLPVANNKLHGWKHFAGLYAGEHVAATEFVIGATFVALGASTIDILLGLLIGNLLAMCSWWLITAPIAVETRLSLYNYLNKIAGIDSAYLNGCKATQKPPPYAPPILPQRPEMARSLRREW